MIRKGQTVNGKRVRILGKSTGVSLDEAEMKIGDIVIIERLQRPEEGNAILAHKEDNAKLYTFLPEDLESI